MKFRFTLLTLPIYRRSYKKYYSDRNKWVAKEKIELENQFKKSFSELDRVTQNRNEEYWQWRWPPWEFNDIIGFIDIFTDGGRILGEMFLKIKHFPKSSRTFLFNRHKPHNQKLLYYTEIREYMVQAGDNKSYVNAIEKLIADAQKIIQERVRTAEIILPEYSLKFIDFARAHSNLQKLERTKPKEKNR